MLPEQNIIDKTINELSKNGFRVLLAEDEREAEEIFWEELYEEINPKSVSYGDSLTLRGLNILDDLKDKDIEFIETFGNDLSWREQIHNRKKALSVDLFLTGTNAITDKGQLVNLDMVGNRIGGIAFGPRRVVIFVGVNKIVSGLDEAMERVRRIAAPQNAINHPTLKTPCQIDGICIDCNSRDRICNSWLITEKSYPRGRIIIILINKELGL